MNHTDFPLSLHVGGVGVSRDAAAHMERQQCSAATRSSKETQIRHEPREPAAEASAASAPGRHDGHR